MQKAGEVTQAQGFSSLPATCSSRARHRTQLRATQTLEVASQPSGEHLLLLLAPDTKCVPWKAPPRSNSRLTDSQVGVDRGVTGRAGQVLVFPVRDVLVGPGVSVFLGQAKINDVD